jgi:cytochrome c556
MTGRTLGAAAAAITLALGGCGGGGRLSKAEYEQKLQQAGKELSVSLRQLSGSTSKPQFEDGVKEVEKALNDAADDLDGITPPEDVEAANRHLVEGFRRLSDEFDEVKAAADQGPDAARQKGRELTTGAASREADQAIKEIQRRGYDVGQLGS